MDETQRTQHLKNLISIYLQAAEDEVEARRIRDAANEEVERISTRRSVYARTLRVEGIDSDNIPAHLLNGQAPPRSIPQPEDQPEEGRTAADQLDLVESNNNGNAPAQDTPEEAVNKTHAVFLVLRKGGNVRMTADAITKSGKAAGYDLSRDDVVRVLGRQVARELMGKDGDQFWLTTKGLAFDKFRKVEA